VPIPAPLELETVRNASCIDRKVTFDKPTQLIAGLPEPEPTREVAPSVTIRTSLALITNAEALVRRREESSMRIEESAISIRRPESLVEVPLMVT
jgi:hypothetical protein